MGTSYNTVWRRVHDAGLPVVRRGDGTYVSHKAILFLWMHVQDKHDLDALVEGVHAQLARGTEAPVTD